MKLLILSSVATLLVTTSCANYTAAPICESSSQALAKEVSGTYYMVSQDQDDFSVQRLEFEIGEDSKMRSSMLGDTDIQINICHAGEKLIAEMPMAQFGSFGLKGYAQAQIFIDETGIAIAPVVFDRPTLDDLGIGSDVVDVGDMKDFLAVRSAENHIPVVSFLESGWKALLVDNRELEAADVLKAADHQSGVFQIYRDHQR